MAVRIGVDVGGTFTKAVACLIDDERVVARAVVPTTTGVDGPAGGVAATVRSVAARVEELGLGPILTVAHSTTQAVNALLEGDTAVVGVLGIGRQPDLARARKRTQVASIGLAPGRRLHAVTRFLDVTGGIDAPAMRAEIEALRDAGAEALCISEAYSVDDPTAEQLGLEIAAELGIPACAGHELTGLYGLEMRTVTGALNAGILPRALEAARVVEAAVQEAAPGATLLVMRGDGGAADMRSMRRHPILTAFSGPAASVSGVLRRAPLRDGIVLEVGGTSTNVSVVRNGRPVLAYVRVLEHLTSVRSLDVRVAGVGGGSLLRIERRWGRQRIAEVGPRSAHGAGLPYACFADPAALAGGEVRLEAPRPGDPAAYAVLHAGERRYAITLTCAANAIDAVPAGAYAEANAESARIALAALGRFLGQPGERLAVAAVDLAADKILPMIDDLAAEHRLGRPELVGVGGGAGALVPHIGARRRLSARLPDDGEVISSIGDALSLVRVEIERSLGDASPAAIATAHRAAEEAAVAAGADPATLQVTSEPIPERRALRVIALGAFALGRDQDIGAGSVDLAARAHDELGAGARRVGSVGPNELWATEGKGTTFAVFDRSGALLTSGQGAVLHGSGSEIADRLRDELPAMTRHVGPVAIAPMLRVLRGPRLVDLSLLSSPGQVLEAALAECSLAGGDPIIVLCSRS